MSTEFASSAVTPGGPDSDLDEVEASGCDRRSCPSTRICLEHEFGSRLVRDESERSGADRVGVRLVQVAGSRDLPFTPGHAVKQLDPGVVVVVDLYRERVDDG